MKIVNRKEFLAMPEGALFSKYQPYSFGPLCIKGESVGVNDFCVQAIEGAIRHHSSEEFCDLLENAEEMDMSLEMDFDCEYRDGLFDEDQLFAVWERQDLDDLISRLVRAYHGNSY